MTPARSDEFRLGAHQVAYERRLAAWDAARFGARLWAGDPTLWVTKPAAEISDRLGWLRLPESMAGRLPGFRSFAEEIQSEGTAHIVLLGMGGSSLTPELFQKTLGSAPGYPALLVLDSTHPAAVAATEKAIDLSRTIFLVSSKSGSTIEPLSFFRYFWDKAARAGSDPGRRFVAISDPGSSLQALARERGFRQAFAALPDVGGRFSALTDFGLVPAALIGADAGALLAAAGEAAAADGPDIPAAQSPGFRLGAALGELALAGIDKLTIRTSPGLRSFPDWLEQLIAESTGKDGKGIVPVAGEPVSTAAAIAPDRAFVFLALGDEDRHALDDEAAAAERAGRPVIRIELGGPAALGREIFHWELAVAAASSALGVHPFNQPDVELAKDLARKTMAARAEGGAAEALPGVDAGTDPALGQAVAAWLGGKRERDYVCLQAYLGPGPEIDRGLDLLRERLLAAAGRPVTLGRGPRFLHSTGQLHKGGPDEALVLQIVDRPVADLAVPGAGFGFGTLIRAQADGDLQALRQRGRRALRVDLGGDAAGGLERLAVAISRV